MNITQLPFDDLFPKYVFPHLNIDGINNLRSIKQFSKILDPLPNIKNKNWIYTTKTIHDYNELQNINALPNWYNIIYKK